MGDISVGGIFALILSIIAGAFAGICILLAIRTKPAPPPRTKVKRL